MSPEGSKQMDSTPEWDELSERTDSDPEPSRKMPKVPAPAPEKVLTPALFAAAWADLVCITAVCTLALLTLLGLGYQATVPAFPWAAAVGVLWWSMASATTLVVRRGTPGMVMAGVLFDDAVSPTRLPAVIAVELLLSASLGVFCLLGPARSPLRLASGLGLTAQELQNPSEI